MHILSTQTKIVLIVFLFFLLLLSALFSAAETAYTSLNYFKLKNLNEKKPKSYKLMVKHLNSFGWILSTILIGNNLVNIAASTLISFLFSSFLPAETAAIVATATLTPIIVIFGEVVPKIIARKYPIKYLVKVVYLMEFINWLFFPFTFWLKNIVKKSSKAYSEDELMNIIDQASKEKILENKEAILVKNALSLDSKSVKDVMLPMSETKSINIKASRKVILDTFIKNGLSRLPVISNKKVIGILTLKTFVSSKFTNIKSIMIKPIFVSKNQLLSIVLEVLQKNKHHLAIVTPSSNNDTFLGIITLEDIVEELIGEVYDEHDKTGLIREIGLDKFIASGSSSVKVLFNNFLKMKCPSDVNDENIKSWIQSRINRRIRKNLKYTWKKKVIFKVVSNKRQEETIFEIVLK